jgi:hypothetical protein
MASVTNDAADLPLVFDEMRNFAGGEDSFRDPIELDPDQCQHLINVVIRDKLKARTRPGADPLGGAAPAGAAPVRGLTYFNTPNYSLLIAVANGAVYSWNNAAWAHLAAWSPANANTNVEMAQGVDSLLISDGVGNLQKYDGVAFTDLGNGPTSPPVGTTILCYHTGRMFAAGQSANPDTIWVSLRLDFNNGSWNTATRSFRVGGGEGDPIMGLASMQQFVLAVLKQNSIWLTVTDPRNEPANFSASQAGDIVSDGIGCVGRKAWCKYGNDILFLSQDGVRSLQRMVAAAGQWQLSAPISVPIQPYIDRINWNYATTACAVKYREFAFFAVPLDNSTYPNYVLVWNGRLEKWIGVFQGWTPTAWALTRFNGILRCVFGDNVGLVNLWKDLNAADQDATYQDNGQGYASQLWGRAMAFGDLEANKIGFNARVRFNAGNANLLFTAVGNDQDLDSFSQRIAPRGDLLGAGMLPFQLASQQPSLVPLSLRGLPSFNELFLKIESTSGWWELRNFTVGVRVRPLKRK